MDEPLSDGINNPEVDRYMDMNNQQIPAHPEMWPVMITPFDLSGGIDWQCLDAMVEWYISMGADGLFPVCLSSEMYNLTPDERLDLARRVVDISHGRVPVIASGTFGGSMESQADYVRQMADTGVSAVVVITPQIADQDAGDDEWLNNLHELISLTGNIPLGIYECPVPYHRLLSPDLVRMVAETGRFHIYKDTSCRRESIKAKIEASAGTPLRWMNANAPTLLYSLQQGGGGFMGIAANFLPGHLSWLCRNIAERSGDAVRLQRFISIADMVIRNKYPTSAKLFQAGQGIPIEPVCRDRKQIFSEEELIILEHLREAFIDVFESIGK